jgi:hypothetical protein
MGASIPSKESDSQVALLNKLELVRPIVDQLVMDGSLSPQYSYEQFCQDLDLGDVYSKRLVELLVKETYNKTLESIQESRAGGSFSSHHSDQVYITSSSNGQRMGIVPNGPGSSKWFYQSDPRDNRRRESTVSEDSLAGMEIQELDGLRVVDSWDQDR